MRAIRGKGTALEEEFLAALREQSVRGLTKHRRRLPGTPDIVHQRSGIVVFINSCFWHGCREHLRMPKSNKSYWVPKIRRNSERDRRVEKILRQQGWHVIRIWEHSIRKPRMLRWWATRIKTLISLRPSSKPR